MTDIIFDNIEELTLANNNFRKVISTSNEMQLVLMNLLPGEDIGMEVHKTVTQFIRIEKGEGQAQIDYGDGPVTTCVNDGDFVFIPAGSLHNITNTSRTQSLKLYTLYAPPNHKSDRVDKYKPESD